MKVVIEGKNLLTSQSPIWRTPWNSPWSFAFSLSFKWMTHLNRLSVSSQITDRYIEKLSPNDHEEHQKDLNNLKRWAERWGMHFNAKKSYTMSSNKTFHKENTVHKHEWKKLTAAHILASRCRPTSNRASTSQTLLKKKGKLHIRVFET